MFEFEKLDVYKKAKIFNADVREFIKATKLDPENSGLPGINLGELPLVLF